jgi:hypothetical protein
MDQLLRDIEDKIQGNYFTPEARAFLRQVSDRIRVGTGVELDRTTGETSVGITADTVAPAAEALVEGQETPAST